MFGCSVVVVVVVVEKASNLMTRYELNSKTKRCLLFVCNLKFLKVKKTEQQQQVRLQRVIIIGKE